MKKYIVPILIVSVILLWIIFYGFGLIYITGRFISSIILNIIVIGVMVALIIALIAVLIQRIKEIKEEDKDDLSKY